LEIVKKKTFKQLKANYYLYLQYLVFDPVGRRLLRFSLGWRILGALELMTAGIQATWQSKESCTKLIKRKKKKEYHGNKQ
jgi:hypothetical protein